MRAAVILIFLTSCSSNSTADEMVLRTGSFTFPALASAMTPIIQEQGLDAANGLRLEAVELGSVSAYYAALASGEVDTVAGGPLILQRMRKQGVPVVIANTYATLASLSVVANGAAFQRLEDLRGRRLAADMSSSEYQILRLIARHQGLELGQDVEVLQAVPSVARAHLESGQAEAMLTFEPATTLALESHLEYRIVQGGQQGWQQLGHGRGWLLVTMLREDWIERFPSGAAAWRKTLQTAADFINDRPQEADRIVSTALHLPQGVFLRAVQQGRIEFSIHPAAEESESLQAMFQAAVDSGFTEKLPDEKAILH